MRDLCCGHNAVFLFMMIDVTHTNGRLIETALNGWTE